ncbi:MAG: tyrosine-type recombinase/integrase [Oscillospiraceae bacterium]|nr:tyrosine-type recombinase/integrase [Oscillospiraceae bacterium]
MKRDDIAFLPLLVQDYIRALERKQTAELTILEYASDLRLFFYYMAQRHHVLPSGLDWDEIDLQPIADIAFIRAISTEDAEDFISYCRNVRGNNANTLNRRYVAVRRFFRYLTVRKHLLDKNPLDGMDGIKTAKSLPVYLPLDDCVLLLNTVEQDLSNPFRERDYCILVLFLNCGLRLSELCNINLADIASNDTVRVRGKGSKDRTVYLNAACLAALERYLRTRPQDGLRHEDRDALFISRNKRRINPRSVELMLTKYLQLCGLENRGYSIHKLRHTAATLMYQNNVDVRTLKEILGHENLNTTQIYTHVANQQLADAVQQNPLANLRTED